MEIQFLGHTSFLVKFKEHSLIIDPNLSQNVFLLKRRQLPRFNPFELKKTNTILISNAHPNRLNIPSFKFFKQNAEIILPEGLSAFVKRNIAFRCVELTENQQYEIMNEIKVTAIKSLHRGFRYWPLSQSMAAHYLIEYQNYKILYVTDTPYKQQFFQDLGKNHQIDLAIIPISYIGPEFLCSQRYLNSQQALKVFQDLNAKHMIPQAHSAFCYPHRNSQEAKNNFLEALDKMPNIKPQVSLLEAGETFTA